MSPPTAGLVTSAGAFPGTANGALPGSSATPASRPDASLDIPTVEGDYALTFVQEDGSDSESIVISGDDLGIDFVTDLTPVREHSAISDWRVTVPHGASGAEDLLEWVRARAYLTFDSRIVFVGELTRVNVNNANGTVSLEGSGMGGKLRSGDIIFQTGDVYAFEAIEECWEAVAPKWTVDVLEPHREHHQHIEHWPGQRFEDGFDGSPLEILQKIHDDLGWRFIINRRRPYRAVSFREGDIVLPPTWTTIEVTPQRDISGYYNRAVVKGAVNEQLGRRVQGEYTDEEEVARLMEDSGRSEEEATFTYRETDPELETAWGCRLRAENRVKELVQEDSVTAKVNCEPVLVPPGPRYTIDEFDDDRRIGAWSLHFDAEADAYVTMDPAVFDPTQGAMSLWLRPTEHFARRHLIGGDKNGFRLLSDGELTWQLYDNNTGTFQRVASFPDGDAPLEEWSFIHVDWHQTDSGELEIRAGHDGTIGETGTLANPFQTPDNWYFSAPWSSRATEFNVDDPRIWASPLASSDYETLADRRELTETPRHRWPFRKAVGGDPATVYDVAGGHHGIIADRGLVTYDGNPMPLKSADFREGHGRADGNLNFNEVFELANEFARLRDETRRTQQLLR